MFSWWRQMCSANMCNSRTPLSHPYLQLSLQPFQQILFSSHSLIHFSWDNINKHSLWKFFKLTRSSMTETCCRAITQAAPMAKVRKERKEQKAECRNDSHEHSWIQNLTPPNPHKKQMTIHCFRVSACPLGRFTLPVIVLLNFLLSYILSVIFNYFFPLATWQICCICPEEGE